MEKKARSALNYRELAIFALFLFFIYLTSYYNYLLFHTLAELFSIVIAGGIFVIGWNSRKRIDNSYFLVMAIAFIFIGFLDLIHTLAYTGMGIFIGFDSNLPTSLWIGARYFQAFTYLLGIAFINKKINSNYLLYGYAIITSVLLITIFGGLFPTCYIEGSGLTPFKIVSEYVINILLFSCIMLMYVHRQEFEKKIHFLLIGSIIATMIGELAFTFYVSVYGISNLVGHLFKIISFFLLYVSIIQKGIEEPFDLLFRKLKRSELELKNIITHSGAGIIMLDEKGTYLLVNEQAAFELGGKPEDFVGKTLHDIFPKDLADEYLKSNFNLITEGKSRKYERTFDLPVGKKTFYILEQPLKDITEKYYTLLSIASDITDIKKFQQEIYNLSKFPSENPNPVMRVKRESILYSNKAAKELFGIKVGGKIPEQLRDSINFAFDKEVTRELEIVLKNKIYSFIITPIIEQNYANIYGMNISARKKAEQKLEEFASTVSHELRTPLTVLIMSIDYLKKQRETLNKEVEEQLINSISRNILLMNDLVEDILTLSRTDDKKVVLEKKEFFLNDIIEDILNLMEPRIKEKNITINQDFDQNMQIFGDKKRIDQVFRILIDNAIKYSDENSMIRIVALENYKGNFNSTNSDGSLFQIIDNGRGILEKDISHLFERFFRAKNARDVTGSGLGLAIAKHLTELHGGEIFVESEYAKGSTFSVFLPKHQKS